MIRTTTMAALVLALMSSAAFAQADNSNGPPAQLSGGQSYDDRNSSDRDYDDRDAPPPPSSQDRGQQAQNGNNAPDPQRDVYCRRSAAAATGYVTPGEAADHEQAARDRNEDYDFHGVTLLTC